MLAKLPLKQVSKIWRGLNSLKKDFYTDFFQNEIVNNEEKHNYIKNHLIVVRGYRKRSRDVGW